MLLYSSSTPIVISRYLFSTIPGPLVPAFPDVFTPDLPKPGGEADRKVIITAHPSNEEVTWTHERLDDDNDDGVG